MATKPKAPPKEAPQKKIPTTGINGLVAQFKEWNKKYAHSYLSKQALNWFKRHADAFVKKREATWSKVTPLGEVTTRPMVGKLYMYKYDPKHKETLPLYDIMPIVLITKMNEDGWTGINFHYMPTIARLKIMAGLYDIQSNTVWTEKKKINVSWSTASAIGQAVGKHEILSQSVKQYLANHVASPLVAISPKHWSMIIFLPFQRFKYNDISAARDWH